VGIVEELVKIWPNEVCDRATKCGGSMSDQLTVFSREAFVMVCKG